MEEVMAVNTQMIKDLRERTNAGMSDCKKALDECGGDIEKAVDWLRAKGIASAAKKAGRIAAEGAVHSYIHAGGRIGVLLEVNCETDFVAMGDAFKGLVADLGLHIAAAAPRYLDRDDVPADVLANEKEVQKQRVMEEGKPAAVAERIVEGRIGKFYEEICLLEQKFVKDDAKSIRELVAETSGKCGEKVAVRRFVRFELGEGIQKRQDDFAAEVAAQAGIA
jgi:elongation factor Ts